MFRLVIAAAFITTAALTTTIAGAQSTPKVVPESLRVRAFGDGVTAGFGYDGNGVEYPASARRGCEPADSLSVGQCSSNSSLGPGTSAEEPAFVADGGSANGVSWAAQVAKQLGSTDFANYAVSGSRLVNWLDLPPDDSSPEEGRFHGLLDRLISEDPDLVLASIGGQMLLDMPGGASLACASHRGEAQAVAFAACIDSILQKQLVKQRVMAISFDVLAHTLNAKIVYTTYFAPSPFFSFLDHWQLAIARDRVRAVLDEAVGAVKEAGAAWAGRITSVDGGIDRIGDAGYAPSCIPASGPLRWSIETIALGCPLRSPLFTALSDGTVPNAAAQTRIAVEALGVIRTAGWA